MIDVERIRAATAKIRSRHTFEDVVAIVTEETGELLTAMARMRRGRCSPDDVKREALDCIIVCVSLIDALGGPGLLVSEKMSQIESYAAPTLSTPRD